MGVGMMIDERKKLCGDCQKNFVFHPGKRCLPCAIEHRDRTLEALKDSFSPQQLALFLEHVEAVRETAPLRTLF